MGHSVGDTPVASQHAFPTAQNSGMASDQEGALCLQQQWGGTQAGHSPPFPGQVGLSWPWLEQKKAGSTDPVPAGHPVQLGAPGAAAQPGGRCIPSPVRAKSQVPHYSTDAEASH